MQNEHSFHELFSVVKGVVVALVCSLLLALLFSLLLHLCPIPSKAVYPVNQVCKVLSIALGAMLCIRGEKGWLKGGVLGLLFTMLSYLVFAGIGGDFSLGYLLLVELLAGVFTGALCGIIAVNVKK